MVIPHALIEGGQDLLLGVVRVATRLFQDLPDLIGGVGQLLLVLHENRLGVIVLLFGGAMFSAMARVKARRSMPKTDSSVAIESESMRARPMAAPEIACPLPLSITVTRPNSTLAMVLVISCTTPGSISASMTLSASGCF